MIGIEIYRYTSEMKNTKQSSALTPEGISKMWVIGLKIQ